jgi:hypothetical protein
LKTRRFAFKWFECPPIDEDIFCAGVPIFFILKRSLGVLYV